MPGEWTVAFVPTMDNTYGDFRLPVTADNKMIGLEARRFAWARETEALAKTAMLPATDDQPGRETARVRHAVLRARPVPDDADAAALDAELAKLTAVDPAVPVIGGGQGIYLEALRFLLAVRQGRRFRPPRLPRPETHGDRRLPLPGQDRRAA